VFGKRKSDIYIAILVILITLFHYMTPVEKIGLIQFYGKLYFIPVILSSFIYGIRGGVFVALISSVLYSPHLLFYVGKLDVEVLNRFLDVVLFVTVAFITGYLVDVEKKQKEVLKLQFYKLKNLENELNNIFESMNIGVLSVDRDYRIKTMNKSAKKLLDIESYYDGILLRTFVKNHDLFVNMDRVEMTGIPVVGQELFLDSKERIPVKYYIFPVKNHNEKLDGLVIILEDIGVLKNLEEQVRRADKLSALGELASGIAHEIRNPLSIMKTIVQNMLEDTSNIDEGELLESLNILKDEIERMNKIIKTLLDFAKPKKPQRVIVNLRDLITETIKFIKPYLNKNDINITLKSDKDVYIYVDEDQIRQCFLNILLNAIQSIDNVGNIAIEYEEQNNYAKIVFADNGVGMDEEQLKKIFNPFYTTKDYGTGLGLSVTYRLIEENGGFIEVESRRNIGTKVMVYLPIYSGEGEGDEKEGFDS